MKIFIFFWQFSHIQIQADDEDEDEDDDDNVVGGSLYVICPYADTRGPMPRRGYWTRLWPVHIFWSGNIISIYIIIKTRPSTFEYFWVLTVAQRLINFIHVISAESALFSMSCHHYDHQQQQHHDGDH